MCKAKIKNVNCPTCGIHMDTRFIVVPCVTLKYHGLSCCTSLTPAAYKVKEVKEDYPCYGCRLDAPRRAEEAKKAAKAARKAARALEESLAPKSMGGDVDLVLHSAQYW